MKNRNSIRLITLLIAILMTLCLTACGGGSKGQEEAGAPEEEQMLDNAQEACKASADRTISLSGVYQAPYLNIICRNPVPEGAAPVKARRIPELGRGIGMTILSQLAERYDGRFSTAEDGKTFTAEIILKGDTA